MAYLPQNIVSIVSTVPSSVQVGASVMGHAPVVIVGGSILTSSTDNQSVSGVVGASIIAIQHSGGYLSAGLRAGSKAYADSDSNTLSTFQGADGTPTVMEVRSAVFNGGTWDRMRGNSSIGTLVSTGQSSVVVVPQGSIAVNIIAGSVTVATGNSSVQVLNPVSVLAVTQSGVPWANTNVGSVITVSQGSIAVNIIAGSVTVATGNSSVQVLNPVSLLSVTQGTPEWTVKSSLAGGIFPISGSVAVGNFPATQVVAPNNSSLFSIQPAGSVLNVNISGSVATVGTAAANQSVSGTVQTDVIGSVTVVIIGGSVATATTNSSVTLLNSANVIGSVIAYQGATPWAMAGSVAGFQAGTWNVSIVGTMAGTSSVYAVLSSITTVSVLNANADRKGATIYNAAGTQVFIKLGTAATTSVYTVSMNNNEYYELPSGWTGVVAGISASNAGIINVTELS